MQDASINTYKTRLDNDCIFPVDILLSLYSVVLPIFVHVGHRVGCQF